MIMRLSLWTLMFTLVASGANAVTGEWILLKSPSGLNDCTVRSVQHRGASFPDLKVTYSNEHRYFDIYDGGAWVASCRAAAPLDLSGATRFTCNFQTNAGHGYYSGEWYLRLIDEEGHTVDYLIHQEAWRARSPVFVERELAGLPDGFKLGRVAEVQIRGFGSVQKQQASVLIRGLHFDGKPVGEADRRRSKRWQSLQSAVPESKSFLVHTVPAAEKMERDQWDPKWTGKIDRGIELYAARGGHADFQTAILPIGSSSERLRVRAHPLKGPGGSALPASCVRFSEVLWVPTLPKNRPDVYDGWYPDPLKPLLGGELPVDPRTLSLAWVEVSVPKDAVPGRYRGAVEVSRQGVTRNVPFSLVVNNFVLPERPTFRTCFWFFPNNVAGYKGISADKLTFADMRPYIDLALEHRITPIATDRVMFKLSKQPDGSYDIDLSEWEHYYAYVMEHGGNLVHLGHTHWFGPGVYNQPSWVFGGFPGETPEDRSIWLDHAVPPHRMQILRQYFEKAHSFLDAHGWEDYAYLQPWDEANADAITNILPTVMQAIKTASPQTRIAYTGLTPENLRPYVDMPVPTIPVVDNPTDGGRESYVGEMKRMGKRPWFYSCVSYGIVIPEVAVRDRMIPLFGFNSGAEGYLFWAINISNPQPGFPGEPLDMYRSQRGTGLDGMGDGVLVYPTPDGQVLSSIRLKCFRIGMEDYEFLNHLSTLYKLNKGSLKDSDKREIERLLVLDKLLFYEAWEKPGLLDEMRRKAGEWIDRMTR